MFGFKPKHEDLTGQPAKSEDDKLYGRYGKMIEDKLEKLEHKLAWQMLCSHESYSVAPYDAYTLNASHMRSIGLGYKKICDDCKIMMGHCGLAEKEQRDYEVAKQKVEEFEESQLKEPEELPAEATEFRGDLRHIKKLHRINKAKYILEDALNQKEAIDSGQINLTRNDMHNIFFKAVEQALIELSKD